MARSLQSQALGGPEPARMRRSWSGLAWAAGLVIALLAGTGCGSTATADNADLPSPLPSAAAAASASTADDDAVTALALQRASDATVGLLVRAVPGARSARTLGTLRTGSGVVIGPDGLVLTIGYLILEAQDIVLELDDGRHIPARQVGYDQATGFGLVQALAPIGITPVPLGTAEVVSQTEPLLIISGGRAGQAGMLSQARVAHQREFSGTWEYHIRNALFTAPARPDHSGAGLFNRKGELVGIGSLLVSDVAPDRASDGSTTPRETRTPGNMFVPVDLLKPVLGELRASGNTRASKRAWLGLNCQERNGQLVVLRVAGDGPAELAGVRGGDVITALDGGEVHDLPTFYRRLWGEGPAEREVKLQITRPGEASRQVLLRSVDRATTLLRADGI